MFIRIVKLTFEEDKIEDFKTYFSSIKDKIRNFPGCTFLEVYQDKHNPAIFFTYSYWEKEANLDDYRDSELFKEVWPYVKTLFSQRAEAWSVDKYITLK
ncbi:MAG: antibiotic biosynthesis monooxygenase [Flavobacteriaceae bacterium]|jgi:quinol monooxygenase YgiN|nr:antibiotic biosynthesis monooxygenase [Flavobacteriaceae bacterium]